VANTIDIDTGGTYTDCFVYRDGDVRTVKVATTPHDLTICFLEGIKAGASAFQMAPEDLLYGTDVIRFSNTIGTNTIIQRDGAKIGLLVSAGREHLAPTDSLSDQRPLVAQDMVIGLQEETDAMGSVNIEPGSEAILYAAQTLIDRGARCLVVAFENSDRNTSNERRVREVIKQEYPRDYLGSVPVYLASDVTPRSGLAERLNTAVLNAYIHGKLARLLYKAGEDLRRLHYRNLLFIGHNNGTVARVAKTRAINTYNSGPAAGLLGAREIGRLYDAEHLITTDMGGTSFDIGYISDGRPGYSLAPEVEGFRCNLPMMEIRAFGAGGGSIARVINGELTVGPQSAGAVPGPACFNLGGTESTLTDANVVLGILDADYFLGGSKLLDRDRARASIQARIAEPLGLDVEEAAALIRRTVETAMGREVAAVKSALPESAQPLIIAYGGAGAIHACDIAQAAAVRRVVITPFSAVSSAFGSSLLDAGHIYYRQLDLLIDDAGIGERLGAAVSEMRREAERDMRGEGFAEAAAAFELQLFVRLDAGDREVMLAVNGNDIDGATVLARLATVAGERLSSPGKSKPSHFELTTVALVARVQIPHFAIAVQADAAAKEDDAMKGSRPVYLDGATGFEEVPVYAREPLGPGHMLRGPALVESDQTTLLVPHEWNMRIDHYNCAVLEQA